MILNLTVITVGGRQALNKLLHTLHSTHLALFNIAPVAKLQSDFRLYTLLIQTHKNSSTFYSNLAQTK